VISRFHWHIIKTLRLAIPVVIGQLGQIMVGVADTIMVGQVGKVPLAAVSLSNSIFSILLIFGIGVSYAVTPLAAKADGEKDDKSLKDLFQHALFLYTVMGILLSILVWSAAGFLPYFNQPEPVVEEAMPYLMITAVSMFPFMIFQGMRQFSEGLSETSLPMYTIVGSNILNIILNYILIYGKLGLPEMGLMGAGIATLISRIVMALGMIYLMFTHRSYSKYVGRISLKVLSMNKIKKMLSIGLPMGFQFTFEVTAFSFSAIMIGWMGTVPLAAHQIAINLAAITYMAATGMASAVAVRVGNQLGRRDVTSLRYAAWTSVLLVCIFMTVTGVFFISLNHYLPRLYNDDVEVINAAASLLVVAAFFQISDGLQAVGLGMLRGLADVKVPTIITLIAYWIIALPLGYLLGFAFDMGPVGVWYGLLAGLSVAAILLMNRFDRLTRRLKNIY